MTENTRNKIYNSYDINNDDNDGISDYNKDDDYENGNTNNDNN